jgi:hypothetical protein
VRAAIDADLVIASHNFAFHAPAKAILHDVGLQVIEEDATPQGDYLPQVDTAALIRTTIERFPVLDKDGGKDYPGTARLVLFCQRLMASLPTEEGWLTATALNDAGLRPGDYQDAIKLTW